MLVWKNIEWIAKDDMRNIVNTVMVNCFYYFCFSKSVHKIIRDNSNRGCTYCFRFLSILSWQICSRVAHLSSFTPGSVFCIHSNIIIVLDLRCLIDLSYRHFNSSIAILHSPFQAESPCTYLFLLAMPNRVPSLCRGVFKKIKS